MLSNIILYKEETTKARERYLGGTPKVTGYWADEASCAITFWLCPDKKNQCTVIP